MVDTKPVGESGGESSHVARFIPGSTYCAGGNAVLLTFERAVARTVELQAVLVELTL